MLVWECEGGAEDGAVSCCVDWVEGKAVEGGKHGEFELETVGGRDDEGRVMRGCVF